MIKIAFVGRKLAGKSFCAIYLKKQHGFTRMRMDDGVAKAMRFFYLYRPHEKIRWQDRLKFYDAWYKVDPNVHIGYAKHRLSTVVNDVVIEDTRYLNELQELKKLGFTIVRIAAPETRTNIKGTSTAAPGTLVLQEYFNEDKTVGYSADYSIYNNTKAGTYRSLDALVDKLRNNDV